jgi:hypothetical protein
MEADLLKKNKNKTEVIYICVDYRPVPRKENTRVGTLIMATLL